MDGRHKKAAGGSPQELSRAAGGRTLRTSLLLSATSTTHDNKAPTRRRLGPPLRGCEGPQAARDRGRLLHRDRQLFDTYTYPLGIVMRLRQKGRPYLILRNT